MERGLARKIADCWTRLRAAREASVIQNEQKAARYITSSIRNEGEAAQRRQFDMAKTGVNRLELQIVRCVLAPPERVCLEIMS
jgi:hypothetical protein